VKTTGNKTKNTDAASTPARPSCPPPWEAPGPKAAECLAWAALALLPVAGYFAYQGGLRALSGLNQPDPPALQRASVPNPIRDVEWDNMTASLDKLASGYRGHVGIYLKDLNSGRVWQHNPDRLFPSASLIKVPIMVSILSKIKSGELSLETRMKLTRRDRAGGSGSLKWAREGTTLSVTEILFKMITESDNTATKMLIANAGIDYLQRAFGELGLVHTGIFQEGMSLASGRVERENYTTPREMAGLLERIYLGEIVDAASSEYMLDVLKHNNKSRTRLRKALPPGWELGHKTGLLRRSCHDVGIVFSPRGDYVIAVLTGEVPDYASAKNFIARVARSTYEYYRTETNYAAAQKGRPSGA